MAPQILFCRNSAGDRLAYTVFGEGPILLVTPPWISTLEVQLEDPAWMGLYGRLARKHTVVTLDKQGCGLSDRDRSDFSLDRDVEDALTVVDQLGQEQFALFGSSQGGPLAIGVAAARPEQVTHLALYGSYVRGPSVFPEGDKAFVNLVRASWGLGSRTFATLFLPMGIDDPTAMKIVLQWERAAASPEMAARLLDALFSWDVTDLAAGLDVPTLVMHRRQDRAFSARVGRDLAAAIPGSRFVLLDGDGHVPWYGDTDAMLTNLAEFLGDDPAPILRPLAPPQPVEVAGPRVDLRGSATAKEYSARLTHLDALGPEESPRDHCRVGLAQMSLPGDFMTECEGGLTALRADRVGEVRQKVNDLVTAAADQRVDMLLFPELAVDLKVKALRNDLLELAATTGMLLIPGSFHDIEGRRNVSTVFGPQGVVWEQEKHLPAILSLDGQQVHEAIPAGPKPVVIANTPFGRVAIVICRDFLDLDLRVALRRCTPAVDLILNPAFTPVTADFQAAHFEARRSLFAYGFFCNVAQFGGSAINTPEKSRRRRTLPGGRESILWKDVDLVGLRVQRDEWADIRGRRQFIQSTR